MKPMLRLLALLAIVFAATGARAAITCTTITATAYTVAYVANTTNSLQLSFTISCNRGSTSDPTTMSYTVKADNGNNPKGVNNQATLVSGGTTYVIGYDVYTPSCSGGQWKGNQSIGGTVSWAANQTGIDTDTQVFWACINSPTNPGAAGAYTDSITMTASYNPGTGNTSLSGTIPVTIYAPASCVVNPAPGNVNIVYPAFSAVAQTATTNFSATCTSPMPYSLSVTPTTGTLAGVNYNVGLSTSSATGTGTPQAYTITVTAPAGQPGTCAGPTCTASQVHTLQITY